MYALSVGLSLQQQSAPSSRSRMYRNSGAGRGHPTPLYTCSTRRAVDQACTITCPGGQHVGLGMLGRAPTKNTANARALHSREAFWALATPPPKRPRDPRATLKTRQFGAARGSSSHSVHSRQVPFSYLQETLKEPKKIHLTFTVVVPPRLPLSDPPATWTIVRVHRATVIRCWRRRKRRHHHHAAFCPMRRHRTVGIRTIRRWKGRRGRKLMQPRRQETAEKGDEEDVQEQKGQIF